MKREERPSSWSGRQGRPDEGRCSHKYGHPMAAVINPSRMKKKLADVVQKAEWTHNGGRNDDR